MRDNESKQKEKKKEKNAPTNDVTLTPNDQPNETDGNETEYETGEEEEANPTTVSDLAKKFDVNKSKEKKATESNNTPLPTDEKRGRGRPPNKK